MAGQGLDSRPRSSKTDRRHGTARVHPSASFSSHIYTTYTRLLPYCLTLPTYYVSPHRFTSNAPPSKSDSLTAGLLTPRERQRDLYAKTPQSPRPKAPKPKAEAQAQVQVQVQVFPPIPAAWFFFFFFCPCVVSPDGPQVGTKMETGPACMTSVARSLLLLRGGQDTRI